MPTQRKAAMHQEWLEIRRGGIGGSDAAAIVGLDRYRSPFAVYADKLGLSPEREDNEAMRQGRDLEDYVAQRFTEATGKKVRRCNDTLQHPEYPRLLANIDRLVVGEKALLECKTTSVLNKAKFAQGEYPPNYYVQCMHYLAVTGLQRCYLAVLVLNQGFHVFTVDRDEDEIAALIAAEMRFWDAHVAKQVPPLPDGTESASSVIKGLYPEAREKEATTLFGQEQKIKTYLELTAQIDALEKERDALKQALQLELGNAEIGHAHGYQVEWRNQSRRNLDTDRLKKEQTALYEQYLKPPQVTRVFKIKEVG